MRFELLAHRRGRANRLFVEVGHVGGGRGRRRVEQVVQDPLAAQHRRGPRGIGGHGQHAALRQHSAARRAGQVHAAEFRSGHARDAVMAREALVEERIPGVDEIEDAAVFTDHVVQEELRLAAHRDAQVVFEVGKAIAVAGDRFERAELQPLPAELLGEGVGLRVTQHPPDVRGEHDRVAQRARVRGAPQRLVRHARPEKIRQPRRQLVLRDRLGRRLVRRSWSGGGSLGDGGPRGRRVRHWALALDAKQEVRRDEERLDPDRQPFVERSFVLLRPLHQRDVLLHFARGHRPAEGAARKAGHDARDAPRLPFGGPAAAAVNLLDALPRRPGDLGIRTADVDRVHAHAIQRDLLELCLLVLIGLAQLGDPIGRRSGRWHERLPRKLGARRWIGTAVVRRQPLVDPGNRDRQLVIARRQPHAELRRLSAEVLPILVEPRGLVRIVDERRDLLVVDPERHGDRLGAGGTHAGEPHADDVFPFGRHAGGGVERVRVAEPGDVVLRGEHARVAVATAVGSQTRERRSQRGRAEDRGARDPIRGDQVFLHERRRERQHVRDVVEAVPGVVLRKVVRRPQVDAQQIPDRVVVLGAVQTPRGHASRVGRGDPIDARELARQPLGHGLALVFRRLRLLFGGHLPVAQLQHDLVPAIAIVDERLDRREGFEVQLLLVFLVAVTADAVRRQEGLEGAFESVGRGGRQDGRARGRGGGLRRLLGQAQHRHPDKQPADEKCAHARVIISG